MFKEGKELVEDKLHFERPSSSNNVTQVRYLIFNIHYLTIIDIIKHI